MTNLKQMIASKLDTMKSEISKTIPANCVVMNDIIIAKVAKNIQDFNVEDRKAAAQFISTGNDSPVIFRAFHNMKISEFTSCELIESIVAHLSKGNFKAITQMWNGTNALGHPKFMMYILHRNGRISTLRLPRDCSVLEINETIRRISVTLGCGEKVIPYSNATKTYLKKYQAYTVA